jgi:hypothetical protein
MVAPAGTHTINPSLMKLPYDTLRDFTAISIIARGPLVLVAHPSLNVATLQALIALAKSRPGQIVAATGGNATAGHLALEMLMLKSGTKFLVVPCRTGGQHAGGILSLYPQRHRQMGKSGARRRHQGELSGRCCTGFVAGLLQAGFEDYNHLLHTLTWE